jgi:Uma2 family endonuclease
MPTVLNPPKIATEERFVLHNVSWETYEQILKNYENSSLPRFTYDQGELEIMSPSQPHDELSRIIALLVNVICEEREIDVRDLGSTTHKRSDLHRGLEPDGCFYIKNVETISGRREHDLRLHPPADLVIEVDLSSPSIAKLPIYAAMGVPEIWHFEFDEIKMLRLIDGRYLVFNESAALPRVLANDVTRFVKESATTKRPQWLRNVREWIRSLDK